MGSVLLAEREGENKKGLVLENAMNTQAILINNYFPSLLANNTLPPLSKKLFLSHQCRFAWRLSAKKTIVYYWEWRGRLKRGEKTFGISFFALSDPYKMFGPIPWLAAEKIRALKATVRDSKVFQLFFFLSRTKRNIPLQMVWNDKDQYM